MKTSDKIFDDPYADGLTELVLYYTTVPDIETKIKKFESICSVVEGFYQVMTNKGELEPIENLEKSEREMLWKMTKGEKADRIKQAKAIYLMRKIKKQ